MACESHSTVRTAEKETFAKGKLQIHWAMGIPKKRAELQTDDISTSELMAQRVGVWPLCKTWGR
jgi:hypothetical protein